jgi:hypothetical protein
MSKVRLFALALAGLSVVSATRAATITEDFSTDPLQRGWQIFGNTNLFRWDSTNHNLAVTWDSTQSNTYFYVNLSNTFSRGDDFGMEFDLVLFDIASGFETNKTGPLQLGFGFLNFAGATSANFMRGAFGYAPDVAEFDYYTSGYYVFGNQTFPADPTTFPSFISGVNTNDYAPINLSVYDSELPTNQVVHVNLSYSGENQTATLLVTTNGTSLVQLPVLTLDPGHGWVDSDNIHVDMFSISSYSSAGDPFDSVFARGTVANLTVHTLFKPVSGLTLAPTATNGVWQAHFYAHTNWSYTLERTSDLRSWTAASGPLPGADGSMVLLDTNAPPDKAFYRVKASQP